MLVQHLLSRFSLVNAAHWGEGVLPALAIVWLVVIACIISSILSQPFDNRQRFFWIALVIFLPGLGVLAYLPFAFRKEELPLMFQRRSKGSKRPKHPTIEEIDT